MNGTGTTHRENRTVAELALRTLLPGFAGLSVPPEAEDALDEGLRGYALFGNNIRDRDQLGELIADLRGARPHALIGLDEEGGDITRLHYTTGATTPGNAALGRVDDTELTREVYRGIGAELRDIGVDVDFAPVADVNTHHANSIIGTRSFGSDPERVARHVAAAVTGLQDMGVAACVKHFPGHGATTQDSHHTLPTVDEPLDVLRQRDFGPFRAAVAAGTRMAMTGHIRMPALTGAQPATFSDAAVTALLRREMGFGGVVVTDAVDMRAVGTAGPGEAVVRALAAGCDLVCLGAGRPGPGALRSLIDDCTGAVVAAVAAGTLTRERLEEANRHGDALQDWLRTPRGTAPRVRRGAGREAARRALRTFGRTGPLDAPLVVQLDSEANLAAGRVPWALAPYLAEVLPACEVLHVSDADAGDFPRERADGRDVVFVSRDTHRFPAVQRLIQDLAARTDVTLVEMGWSGGEDIQGLSGRIHTFGAARVTAEAVARLLADGVREDAR
ncbi:MULTISPECIES: glycoside hydrolase family 3 protein [unclassified Streptomyces]|uniref:glycoside hydrolase family 3 protein n=1 Tax=unclassified Streptomyces TaxID=2593676 RepID=UPI000DAD33C4|nr:MULTISPECIES: glycoside hydrolase family 3 N-terminal domain-containing protein [unclassified Streptomyces]PZT72143.1 glycoside hydrolase family 3 protein [Streptomyces sp. AC1-42T]PZT81536.1 glycoside hydrolase family 3 protein [Streptomyces sp. AC1-42W]